MCELGLDDLASEHPSADDDNTWRQALSAGLVDVSTDVSDTSDDVWNASLAEVTSMMTLTNSANVDDAWDSQELSMVAQSGQVSTSSDHAPVDEWEDTVLTDDGGDTMETLVGTPRQRMSQTMTMLLSTRAWSLLPPMNHPCATPRTHVLSRPRGRHSG